MALAEPGPEDEVVSKPYKNQSTSHSDSNASSSSPEAKQLGSDARSGPNGPINAPSTNDIAKKGHKHPDCEFDKIEECDLTAQKSMAKSTRRMNYAAWAGVGLTVLAVILLWQTLGHTATAADHTKTAANAALAAVEQAEKTTAAANRQADLQDQAFKRLERPYLYIKITETTFLRNTHEGQHPAISYTIVNYGKTPAVLRSVYAELVPSPDLPLRVPLNSDELMYEVIEPAGQLNNQRSVIVKGSGPGDSWIGKPKGTLIFHGLLTYEDAMGAIHRDRFCLRCNEGVGFHVEGGTEYNYRKTIYPEDRADAAEES